MASTEAISLGKLELAQDFGYIAAGITLLEKRATGKVPLETIILVRE